MPSAMFIGFGAEHVAELFGTPRLLSVETFLNHKGFFDNGLDVSPKLNFVPNTPGSSIKSWLKLVNYDKVLFCVRHPYPSIRDMHPLDLEDYEKELFEVRNESYRKNVAFTMNYYTAHVKYSNVLMRGLDGFHRSEEKTRWVKYERLAEDTYVKELAEWLRMDQVTEFQPIRWRFRGNTRLRQMMKLHKGVQWICQQLDYHL